MITKEQKQVVVSELTDQLKRAEGVFMVDFTGLSVAKVTDLRNQLRAQGVEYRVVKNTLAKLAIRELDFDVDETLFKQPTALALSYEDALQPAKILVEFAKKTEQPKIKAAIIEGITYGEEDAKRFASIPSKLELRAKVVGGLQNPVTGLVGTLQAVVREFVAVLDAVREKRQSEEA